MDTKTNEALNIDRIYTLFTKKLKFVRNKVIAYYSHIRLFDNLKMRDDNIAKIKNILRRFILQPNELHPQLQLLSLVIETIAYLAVLNQVHHDLRAQQPYILAILAFLCLVKYIIRCSFGITVYLLVLPSILLFQSSLSFISLAMVIILVIGEILGSIHFDVSLSNITAESNNMTKIGYYSLVLVNVIMTLRPNMQIHLASSLLFLVLFLLRYYSLVKSQQFRSISMSLYLWCSLEHLRVYLANFLQLDSLTAFVAAFIISQLMYFIWGRIVKQQNLFELAAKQQYLNLAFDILKDFFDNYFNVEAQKFIKDLVSQQLENQSHCFKDISNILSGKLKVKKGFLQKILIIQINIINGKFLNAKRMVNQLHQQTKWYYFINLIILYRMGCYIQSKFQKDTQDIVLAYQQQYKHYLNFKELIHKSTLASLRFSLYLRKSEVQLQVVKHMCSKMISYEERLKQQYSDFFSQSTQIYIAYLLNIKNDFKQAESILQRKSIRQKFINDFNISQKIYFQLLLKEDSIVINKVGLNVNKLLGYNCKQLEGQPVERLLPPFFRKCHQRESCRLIDEQFSQVFLYRKSTIVLNSQNRFDECSLAFKLDYKYGQQFSLEGYINVLNHSKHDLSSFLFVGQNGNIIQCSHNLFSHQLRTKNMHINHYFDHPNIGTPFFGIQQRENNIYDPLIKYNGQDPFYFYCKRQETFLNIQKNQDIVVQPKKEKSSPSNQKSKQVQDIIRSKQILILVTVFGLFLCCLFGSQYLLMMAATVKYNNQSFAVENSRNLISCFNYSLKLQLDLAYVDFRDNFNYSNSFIQQDLVNSSLQMQTINEYLKKYIINKYKLNTYSPSISYYQNNFEAVQMLISHATLYSKFHNDTFIRKAALDNFKLLNPLLLQSLLDYRTSILLLVASFVENDIYYDRISLSIALANQLIFLLIILRIYYKLKATQQLTLKFRCQQTNIGKKINETLFFYKMLTKETSYIDKINQEMHFDDHFSKPQGNSTSLRSEMSLIKESPGRSFTNESISNVNFVEQMKINSKSLSAQPKHELYQGKTYRFLLLVVAAFVVILVALTVANYIINSKMKSLDQSQSVNSVINLYRSNGFFSSRGITPSFTTILLKQIKNVNNIKTYTPMIQSYYNFLAAYTIPVFPQTQFPQFNAFSGRLYNLYQKEICNYMNCLPQYLQQLNLNYITVVKKLSSNLSGFVNATLQLNNSQFITYINIPSNKLYIDLLFYSQVILTEYIIDTVMIYLQGYTAFMSNLYRNKQGYIHAMIGVTAAGLCFFAFLCLKMKQQLDLYIKIVKIYSWN